MNNTKKTLSIILSLLLIIAAMPISAVSVYASDYNASDYESLVNAVNSCSGSDEIHLTDNIVLPSVKSGGFSDLSLSNKTFNFYLDGHKLNLGAYSIICEGALNIYKGSADGGEIIADDTAVLLQNSTPTLSVSTGVTITSVNGNAIVSRVTANLVTTIKGATVKAPNGSAYFAGGYGASLTLKSGKLEGKYGITVDLSEAPSVGSRVRNTNYTHIRLFGGTVDGSQKALNINSADIGNGYTANFRDIVRFYIKSGSFSDNIFESNNEISWRNTDGDVITVLPTLSFFDGYYNLISEISSEADLADACEEGGLYSLANDVVVNSAKTLKSDVEIIGNGYTIKSGASLDNLFIVNSSYSGSLNIDNAVFDGNNKAKHFYLNNGAPNMEVVLKNSTVKNFKPGDLYGVIITKSGQNIVLDNVTVTDNTLPVRSEEVCSVCYIDEGCSASFKNCVINGEIMNKGALTIDGGEYTAPDEKSVVFNAENASLTVKDGVFSSELFDYVSNDKFMIRVQDNTSDGKYVVQNDYSGSAEVEETNLFGLNNITSYLNVQLLGVQKKHDIPDVEVNAQEKNSERNIRFITSVNEGIVKGSNVEDYGYAVAMIPDVQPSAVYSSNAFNALKYYGGNGEKTLSCKNTKNNVVPNSGYGDPTDHTTTYKYITLAVNNIDEGACVIARFYIKTKDGKIYYGDYIKGGEPLPGIAASMEALN